jgi:hypothetical protein
MSVLPEPSGVKVLPLLGTRALSGSASGSEQARPGGHNVRGRRS